jgi:hypothetical protein
LALQTQILPPIHAIQHFPAESRVERIANVARELLTLAGSRQEGLELVAELARLLIGVPDVSIRMAVASETEFAGCSLDLPLRAVVASPIYEDQQVIAHLEISSKELGTFDEHDFRILSLLGALASEMMSSTPVVVPEPSVKIPPLPVRIVSRIEGMLPTIRVRLLL